MTAADVTSALMRGLYAPHLVNGEPRGEGVLCAMGASVEVRCDADALEATVRWDQGGRPNNVKGTAQMWVATDSGFGVSYFEMMGRNIAAAVEREACAQIDAQRASL